MRQKKILKSCKLSVQIPTVFLGSEKTFTNITPREDFYTESSDHLPLHFHLKLFFLLSFYRHPSTEKPLMSVSDHRASSVG